MSSTETTLTAKSVGEPTISRTLTLEFAIKPSANSDLVIGGQHAFKNRLGSELVYPGPILTVDTGKHEKRYRITQDVEIGIVDSQTSIITALSDSQAEVRVHLRRGSGRWLCEIGARSVPVDDFLHAEYITMSLPEEQHRQLVKEVISTSLKRIEVSCIVEAEEVSDGTVNLTAKSFRMRSVY